MSEAEALERTAAIDAQAEANRQHRARVYLTGSQIARLGYRPLTVDKFLMLTTAFCRADPFDARVDYFVRAAAPPERHA